MVMHKVARVVQPGMENAPIEGSFHEGSEYNVEDFYEIFLPEYQRDENRCRALQPNATISQPPPSTSHSTTIHLDGAGPTHHIMNGNAPGQIMPNEESCLPAGPVNHGMNGNTNPHGLSRNGH